MCINCSNFVLLHCTVIKIKAYSQLQRLFSVGGEVWLNDGILIRNIVQKIDTYKSLWILHNE